MRGGGYIQVSCHNSLDELLGGGNGKQRGSFYDLGGI